MASSGGKFGINYELPLVSNQSSSFSEGLFTQKLLNYKEGEPRKVSLYIYIDLYLTNFIYRSKFVVYSETV